MFNAENSYNKINAAEKCNEKTHTYRILYVDVLCQFII